MDRASSEDRRYFHRVAAANRHLAEVEPPATLAEMFDRLERTAEQLGPLARSGVEDSDPPGDDLGSHLAFLERLHAVAPAFDPE